MNKNEFLDVLRQSLIGEVNPVIIEQNIKYYDQYIGTRSAEEEERILNELGDPRLIAKTIIETDRMAKQKGKFTGGQNYQNATYNGQDEEKEDNRNRTHGRNQMFFTNFRWYHKAILALVVFVVLILLVVLGKILFTFGLPIILILMVLFMFRRR